MNYFKHFSAVCESINIGEKTNIGAFSCIMSDAIVGFECDILSHVFIENGAVVGNRVIIESGAKICSGVTLEDDIFIGPNVTFVNSKLHKNNHAQVEPINTLVRKGVFIGANATILSGITIGISAIVGAGAVVTNDVPPYAKVVGNPARIIGYTNMISEYDQQNEIIKENSHNKIKGVIVQELPLVKDLRGDLSVGEFSRDIPFEPKRYFLVFNVPNGKVRGEHAHKKCHQFLICVKGACSVLVDDGVNRQEIRLDRSSKGLYLPPLTWGVQYKYSSDAVLLVFASDFYEKEDYIRDYDQFIDLINEK